MAHEYKRSFCKDCEENVKTFRKGTNHILHLLFTLLTAGIWIIVWILASIKHGTWSCDVCGSKRLASAKSKQKLAKLAAQA